LLSTRQRIPARANEIAATRPAGPAPTTSFDTFDSERGKSVDETIELIVDTAERAVCRPGE
jgi:hypothetical protein